MKYLARWMVLWSLVSGPLPAAELWVTLENVRGSEGKLLVALHNNAETYATDSDFASDGFQAYAWQVVEPRSPETRLHFADIPAGRYAVSGFHDENGDRRLNRQIFPLTGMPSEPYVISNNGVLMFGKVRFEDALFEIREPRTEIRISVAQHLERLRDALLKEREENSVEPSQIH